MGEFVVILQGILVVAGLLALTLGVYGVIRMEDVFMKIQATSKIVLLGLLPILAAAALSGDPTMITHSILMAVLLILTTPISAHAITKAAAIREAPDTGRTPESEEK